MEHRQLLKRMNHLGYPLVEAMDEFDPNVTLAEVVKTNNGRYWEGFPVLLANGAKEEEEFRYAKVESFLKKREEKDRLKQLFLLSLALYKLYDFKDFDWPRFYGQNELDQEDKYKVREFEKQLRKNQELLLAGQHFSPERLKSAFQRYHPNESGDVKSLNARQEDLSLDFALSQMFSPKQKELFLKKLRGEVLTKTEREYLSRTVRKKAAALAHAELHRLAQRFVQS